MIISLLFLFIEMTVAEYYVHRFWMHNRRTSFYKSHAIEHHGQQKNDTKERMSLTLRQAIFFYLMNLPIILLITIFLWSYYWIFFACVCIWWSYGWSAVHRLIHGDERFWYARILVPWYPWIKRHHLCHHKKTTSNYGALFFWSDYIFNSYYKLKVK